MDPFAMDFDENKEMTDDNDSTIDMTPEYMFQKFELVLFLLTDSTANLISPQSQLRLQDKLNISDGSVFCIQQELGPVGGNDKRLVLYKMFVGLLQDIGMLMTCDLLRSAYFEATADTFWGCGLDIKMIEQAKQREDFHTKQILGTLTGLNILGWLVKVASLLKSGGSLLINPKTLKDVSPQCHKGLLLVRKTLAEKGVVKPSLKGYALVESMKRKKKIPLNVIV